MTRVRFRTLIDYKAETEATYSITIVVVGDCDECSTSNQG